LRKATGIGLAASLAILYSGSGEPSCPPAPGASAPPNCV